MNKDLRIKILKNKIIVKMRMFRIITNRLQNNIVCLKIDNKKMIQQKSKVNIYKNKYKELKHIYKEWKIL